MKEHLFDKRVVKRALQEGLLSKEEHQRMLDALPDLSHKVQTEEDVIAREEAARAAHQSQVHQAQPQFATPTHGVSHVAGSLDEADADDADDDLDDDLDDEDDEDELDEADEADDADESDAPEASDAGESGEEGDENDGDTLHTDDAEGSRSTEV